MIAVVEFPEVTVRGPEVFPDSVVAIRDSSSDVDSKSLSKVSPLLLFRRPFGFRLKGLENLDKHLDEEDVDVDEIVEAFELPPLEQASL